MTTKTLTYDSSVVPQQYGWDCAPASMQIVLNAQGINMSEDSLVAQEGSDPNQNEPVNPNGTDSIDVVKDVLNSHLPGHNYTSVYMPNDPPTAADSATLWNNIVASINAGNGVVANIVAPPSNYPRAVAPSTVSPAYGGGTVFHYLTIMGYSDDGPQRLWVADPGFRPFEYWISFEQMATLIPPKGYTVATQGGSPTVTDTLFSDVSQVQPVVDDSYPHQVLSLRVSDGTIHDSHFAANYAWACHAADTGKINFFIVYQFVHSNTADCINVMKAIGTPHPRMVVMLDVESGDGNSLSDSSDWINTLYHTYAAWLGNPLRVIGYANSVDFARMWPTRPPGLRVIGAGYGSNPNLPGQIAHQYTDGGGFGGGLPEGASPFGNCDMNSADGLSPSDFATAVGLDGGNVSPNTDGGQMDPRILTAALQWCRGWSLNEVSYTADDPTAENWPAAMLVATSSTLTSSYQSRVAGSSYKGTPVDFWLNTDASVYRTEQAVAALAAQVEALTALVKAGQTK